MPRGGVSGVGLEAASYGSLPPMDVSTSAWSPPADPTIESRSWPPVGRARRAAAAAALPYGLSAGGGLAIAAWTCCENLRSWIVICVAGEDGPGEHGVAHMRA